MANQTRYQVIDELEIEGHDLRGRPHRLKLGAGEQMDVLHLTGSDTIMGKKYRTILVTKASFLKVKPKLKSIS